MCAARHPLSAIRSPDLARGHGLWSSLPATGVPRIRSPGMQRTPLDRIRLPRRPPLRAHSSLRAGHFVECSTRARRAPTQPTTVMASQIVPPRLQSANTFDSLSLYASPVAQARSAMLGSLPAAVHRPTSAQNFIPYPARNPNHTQTHHTCVHSWRRFLVVLYLCR